MSNNLIQCGHCNGNAFIDADFGPGWVEYWAECGQCGVRTQEYTTEEQAANIWNARAAQITPQAGEAVVSKSERFFATAAKPPSADWTCSKCGQLNVKWANRCGRCDASYDRTAPPSPVGPTAGDILISRDAAMTVLARWVYDEHWMKASDDMLAVAVQPSPVAPAWQPIETAPRDGTIILLHQSGNIERGCWDFIENHDCDGTPVYGWISDWGNCHDPDGWLPSNVLPPDSPGNTAETGWHDCTTDWDRNCSQCNPSINYEEHPDD